MSPIRTVILAVSLNLVNGLTGQFSIGHAGFMAVGGYVSAVMLMRGPQEDPYRIFFIVAMLTGATAAAWVPTLRMVRVSWRVPCNRSPLSVRAGNESVPSNVTSARPK